MSPGRDIDEFFVELDKEKAQETEVEQHEHSYFEAAPDDEIIVARAREFDDFHKHWVRREIWLKTAKRVQKEKGSGLRLLTLPGRHLFEVKLYQKASLLAQGPASADPFLDVVGFETDPTVFGLLATASPRLRELCRGDILNALVEPSSENGVRLRQHAPYDIINLDLTANIASKNDGPYSPFLDGVRQCFHVQGAQVGSWGLMVTFRTGIDDTEPTVVKKLSEVLQANLSKSLAVKEACIARYGSDVASDLLKQHPDEGLAQLTAKWIVEQGHFQDWECSFFRHASYARTFQHQGTPRTYSLRKLVFEFRRRFPTTRQFTAGAYLPQAWHEQNVVTLFDRATLLDVDTAVESIKPQYREIIEKEIEQLRS